MAKFEDVEFVVSLIDTVDHITVGCAALIAITITNGQTYEAIYWVHDEHQSIMSIDDSMDIEDDGPLFNAIKDEIETLYPKHMLLGKE